MTVVDASIEIMQNAIQELLAKVENGGVLSEQEAKIILKLKRDFVTIQAVDVRNEVVRKRNNLKTIADKWK